MTDFLLALASVLLFVACSCGVVLVLASVAHDRDYVAACMECIAATRPVRRITIATRSACRWLTEVHP